MKKTIPWAITWFMALMLVFSLNSWGQEQIIYTVGFEANEDFTAGTTYNNTTIKYDGPAAQQWGTYYGTASTTSPISGSQSMQMRWYTSAVENLGYTLTDFDLNNVTKVDFLASSTEDVNVNVSYSIDGGNTFIGDEIILITGTETYTYDISETGEFDNVRIKFTVSLPDPIPTTTSRLYIDDVVVYGIVDENQVATPLITPNGGTFYDDVDVTIATTTDNATIFYSTVANDGPWTEYTGPVTVTETTTLYAYATATDMDDSNVATATFNFPTVVDVADVATLRAGNTDGTIYRLTAEAVLTYQQSFRNQKFIQDATAGIMIDDNGGVITTAYDVYDGITGIIGTISVFGNMVQFVPATDPGTATSALNDVEPLVISLQEFNDNFMDYQSRLVTIENVSFDVADGTNFANGTVYDITDGTINAEFRTTFFGVDYIGEPIPSGNWNITGLPNSRTEGDFMTARNLADFEEFVEEPDPFTTLFEALPTYFGASTERGFAVDADNVYVASRNAGTFIRVHDRLTGAETGTLNTTGITGGTFPINDMEVTADGVIIAGNLSQTTAAGQNGNFKLYVVDETNPALELIVYTWSHDEVGAKRFGDKFTVVGSMSDGSAIIYAADGSGNRVLKWSMISDPLKNGFIFGEPEVITIDPFEGFGATPVVAPKPDGSFYYTASGRAVSKLAADGTRIGHISTGVVAGSATAMKYLGTEGNDDLLAIYQWGPGNENLRVVRVIDGDPANTVIEFITPSLGSAANGNGTGDVAFVPRLDSNADLYVLGTNNGVGGYTSQDLNITFPVYLPPAEPVFARAQFIHNSADLAATSVDVFVNGTLFYGDFDFRSATPFVDVPAGVELTIDVAPAGAGIGSSVFNTNVTLAADETYVIVANGIVSATGYDPAPAFTIYPFAPAREAGLNPLETDLLVFHGSTDAPEVSVWAMGGDAALFNFSYGEFAGYLGLPTDDYVIEVRTADGSTVVAAYTAPLGTLNLEGAALTVVASGFLNPANNSDGPAFGLFVATAAGGALIELPLYEEEEPFVISEFPWLEGFEADSETREYWTQIQEAGAANWTFAAGSSGGAITSAYEGALNARFVSVSGTNTPRTKLVTPVMDLTALEAPRVSFWYGQEVWFGDQNQTKVFYRISPEDEWVEIAHFTANVNVWTNEILSLPEPSATYQLAFEGINNYGRANVLDNVFVEETPDIYLVTFNVEDENGVAVDDAVVTLDGLANAAGDYVFEVEPGTYEYTVAKDGYQSATGSVLVVDENIGVDVVINELFTITFAVEDEAENALENAEIVITDVDETVIDTILTDVSGEAAAELTVGDYFYSVNLVGYNNIEDIAFTVTEDATISVTLVEALPMLVTDPESYNFGNLIPGTESAPVVFTISNEGGGVVVINNVTFADIDEQFQLIDENDYTDGIELETSENITVSAIFAPDQFGDFAATITISYNDGEDKTFDVNLTGTGFDATIAEFPWIETFEDTGTLFPPIGWVKINADGAGTEWVSSTAQNHTPDGNRSAFHNYAPSSAGNQDGWLITPAIEIPLDAEALRLVFWSYNSFPTFYGKNSVLISTGSSNPDDDGFVEVWTPSSVTTSWVQTIIDLNDYAGETIFIAFRYEGLDAHGWYLDDVTVEETPKYIVTFEVEGGNGDITAEVDDVPISSGAEVLEGKDVVFTAVPDPGYRVLEWTVDGDVVEDFTGETWTLNDLMASVEVTVEFEEIPPFQLVTFNVTDFDMTPLEGANVSITGLLDVDLLTDEFGVASVELEDGDYTAVISKEGYASETELFTVDGVPLDIDIMLEDAIVEPFGLLVDVDGADALFSWNNMLTEEFFEGFEGDFPPAGWSKLNPDGGTGWIQLATETTPLPGWQGGEAIAAPDGDNFMVYTSWPQGGAAANDQYLITPEIVVADGFEFSFYLRYWPDAFDDNVDIRISTTTNDDAAAFDIVVETLNFGTGSSMDWQLYTYDLTDYVDAGETVYIAFREYVADNLDEGAAIMIDNVYYGPETKHVTPEPIAMKGIHEIVKRDFNFVPASESTRAFLGYNVFLNDVEVATGLEVTEYQFTNLPYGTHVAGVQSEYSSGVSDIVTIEFSIVPDLVDPLALNTFLDKTGANIPVEIAEGGFARGAALYMDRYVVVPSRYNDQANIYVWDMLSPHLGPMMLDKGDGIIEFGGFLINYAHTVGEHIYVSNLSFGSNAEHPFRVYRWDGLDAEPEIVLSADGGFGRLGDAFSIIGDPSADGSIIAHVNSGGEGQRIFRKWNFVDGEVQNLDNPELITIDAEFNVNSFGVFNTVEGEDNLFLVTGNGIGIALVDLTGEVHAYIPADVVSTRAMDPQSFIYDGKRYLAYAVNFVDETDQGARYEILDLSFADNITDAMNAVTSVDVLNNIKAATFALGSGSGAFFPAVTDVNKNDDGDIMFMAFVTNRGFIVETTGALPATYALTVVAEPVEGGTVEGGGDYYEGATVPVSAVAAGGYEFVNWTVGGTEVSTEAEFHFTMPGAATTLTANFETLVIEEVATLLELRGKPADGTLYRYTGDAVIVAMDGHRNRKFLQDETAAIMIDDNDGVITTEYDLYDVITNVTGDIVIFRDMVQFRPSENTDPSTANTPVDPTVFMLDDVTQGDQAKLIHFMNVTFMNIEDGDVFENGESYNITDGENEFVIRTDFFNVDYIGEEIPTVAVNISGVVITFFETLQLVPRFAADIEEYTEPVGYNVTFNVDMTPAEDFDPENDVVYITGSMFEWAEPGTQPENQTMTRVDDSMIWTKTLVLEAGTYEYKYFLNAGWDGGEWEGAPDRVVEVTEDMVVDNVWRDLVNVDDFNAAQINVFPNPARDNFNITAGSMIRSIVIADITGKVVYNDIINDTQTRIYNAFETGMYIVRIYTDEGVFVRKLQIQK